MTDVKAKRDKTDIKAAIAAGRAKLSRAVSGVAKQGKIKQHGAAAVPLGTTSGEVNDYQAGLADPATAGKGGYIPDDETMPSVKFQTRFSDTMRADSQGNLLAFHAPTLSFGGYHPMLIYRSPGVDPDISALLDDGSVTAPLTYFTTQGSMHHVIENQTRNSMQRDFAAIRPVNMSLQFTPTEAALTAQGSVSVGLASRQQQPAPGSLPAPGFTIGGHVIDRFPSQVTVNNAVDKLSGLLSAAASSFNIGKPWTALWRPEDGQDYVYRDAQETEDTLIANTGDFNGGLWAEFDRESVFATPTGFLSTAGFASPWACTGGLQWMLEDAAAADGTWTVPDAMWTYPSFYVAGAGLVANAVIGRAEFIINWEGIPLSGENNLVSTSPSPNNPSELAQASNVVQVLPPAFTPGANDLAAKSVQAVAAGARDLYNGTPAKAAVEGQSVFKRIAKFVGKTALGFIPIPGLAAAGGALLDAL